MQGNAVPLCQGVQDEVCDMIVLSNAREGSTIVSGGCKMKCVV